ncbi:5'-nucleotidase C-terminal domain-containing protein [Sulfitobacter guttiformis]|uniref:2',3'-cyclic-nucleotide 2'-phosphodiesterase/3'-nucleotidase n=1 Tax=Sulfitobacter guttiformis TaxID=74349 RepID=A0A420DR39_9RHOB|nr:5'-nucleotidase C-terminal domain-containing protein [Sulfitobacter guttiformis]KIN74029.1 2`,3`-cyclic-nucleotide 2`-phosphodiesterase [Sulfitobacter guttiformis KCTC 32187]RKE96650.1 2',3'-cyclic-nucleotide 2'-phosphodiesterase/3'-nucleotidase [Sulfitobacter guttiformis]
MSAVVDPNIQNPPQTCAQIRLLATTDLHGHLLAYDYIKDQPTQGGGLAGLSSLISDARSEATAAGIPVVLVDNGDTFQGTPLASYLGTQDVSADHPIVAALNFLAYNALGLGNHDLDHGLPYLRAVAGALDMPIINSNLRNLDISPLESSLLLPIDLGSDAPASLTLGILSVLPVQSGPWQRHHLGPQTTLEVPETAIRTAAAAVRAAGADLVIVLGHMGVGRSDGSNSDLMASHALARTGQIDAMILGHTHRRLPSNDYAIRDGVDIRISTVGDIPTLMAGHAGSDLGVMDLSLAYDAVTGWRVCGHKCTLRPNGPDVPSCPNVTAFAQSAHSTVRRHLSQQVAKTSIDIHSYFSLVSPSPTQHIIARAQQLQVSTALKDTAFAHLPVLSSAAAHGAGGRDGPENYIHIPRGPVLQRHIAGLDPFTNQTVGVLITGTDVRNWLEHSALLFAQQHADTTPHMLINDDVPAFHFDTIFGLTYRINLSAPAQQRISHLEYNGRSVIPDEEFILATSQFRATGGGGYTATPRARIVCRVATSLDQSIIQILNTPDTILSEYIPSLSADCWRFAPLGGREATILTHPDALGSIQDIAHLKPKRLGDTAEGFILLSITL